MSYGSSEDDYIRVSAHEGDEFLEFPKEGDNTVLLSTLQSQFPNAIGLKYRGSSGAWRSLRTQDNVMDAPKEGWGDIVYCVTVGESNKRKAEDNGAGVDAKRTRSQYLQDMAVMNLPFETTEDELRTYFEKNYGALDFCEIKKFKDTGKSRGYGFIRFKDEETAKEAVKGDHHFCGRKVDVKMKQQKPMKLFVGRVPDNVTTTMLEEYFSKYGTLTDVYIPKPFKNFAFITYASSEDGKAVIAGFHELEGKRLNVMERKTPEEAKAEEARGDYRGSRSSRDSRGAHRDSRGDSRSNNYSYTPGQSYDKAYNNFSGNPVPSTPAYYSQTQPPAPPSGGGGGGSMDDELKRMLMQYLSKN